MELKQVQDAIDAAIREVERTVSETAGDVRAYLASPEGRRARHRLAMVLITLAPALARTPFMRASRIGRLVGWAGGAALIGKIAEMIRDWEPGPPPDRPAGATAPSLPDASVQGNGSR